MTGLDWAILTWFSLGGVAWLVSRIRINAAAQNSLASYARQRNIAQTQLIQRASSSRYDRFCEFNLWLYIWPWLAFRTWTDLA